MIENTRIQYFTSGNSCMYLVNITNISLLSDTILKFLDFDKQEAADYVTNGCHCPVDTSLQKTLQDS